MKIFSLSLLIILNAFPTIAQSNILFLGDTSLGESYQIKEGNRERTNYLKTKGAAYFFKNFEKMLMDSELTITNFESVITQKKSSPFTSTKDYLHHDSPALIFPILKKYKMNYLSLANNHSVDYGVSELVKSFALLNKHQINFFGAGVTEQEAIRPLEIMQGKQKYIIYGIFEHRLKYEIKYKAYAKKSSAGTASNKSKLLYQQIKKSKKENPNATHIAFIHWGKNYGKVRKRETTKAKALIAAGVDMIIGHGAHLLQRAEKIGGKWVFYNIGNFIFPSPGRYAKKKAHPYSLILDLGPSKIKLYPIFSDNKKSKYQPYFINKKLFPEVQQLLFPKTKTVKTGKDKYSHYFEVNI